MKVYYPTPDQDHNEQVTAALEAFGLPIEERSKLGFSRAVSGEEVILYPENDRERYEMFREQYLYNE